jgi:hypothetical protein
VLENDRAVVEAALVYRHADDERELALRFGEDMALQIQNFPRTPFLATLSLDAQPSDSYEEFAARPATRLLFDLAAAFFESQAEIHVI